MRTTDSNGNGHNQPPGRPEAGLGAEERAAAASVAVEAADALEKQRR
jgi:hypothetical protein